MKQHKRFDFNTIDEFDNHISNSILGYNILHKLIVNISGFFINEKSSVFDLGCTSGKLLIEVNKTYGVKCIGYDLTDINFIKPKSKDVDLVKGDITKDSFNLPKSDLIYSIFTLQFLTIEERVNLVGKVYDSLNVNGAFIVCEKEICKDGVIQEVFTFSNYENKRNSFTDVEILNKEKALRTVMNSLNTKENIKIFKKAGFKVVEPFFQSLNFKGYILRK